MMSDQQVKGTVAVTGKELLQYGGQAVIEGVMMRSPHYFAVACRKPDGQIVVQREAVDKTFIGKLKWLNWPFARGTLALLDAMALGTRALRFASDVQLQAVQNEPAPVGPSGILVRPAMGDTVQTVAAEAHLRASDAPADADRSGDSNADSRSGLQRLESDAITDAASIAGGVPTIVPGSMPKSGKINDIAIGSTLVISLVGALVLFKLVPTLATDWLQHHVFSPVHSTGTTTTGGDPGNVHTLNAIDGLIRMVIFFGYIILISQMDQIKRVFMYHGAEHKAINTLEAGLPLTTENALRASRIHPRCGTSFIFIVLLIDLLVIALLPIRPPWFARFLLQVAVTPIVAGIAYETIRFAGKFRRNPLVMAAFAPGMATQFLTTREPDAGQTEVALAALYSVLEAEGHQVPHNLAIEVNGAPEIAEPEAAIA